MRRIIVPPPAHLIRSAVAAALAEDLGLAGDITSVATMTSAIPAEARFVARQPGVIAGLPWVASACAETSGGFIRIDLGATGDGGTVTAGQPLLALSGPAIAILAAERVALNFLTHLSGIATLTRAYVDAVAGTKARIASTRKTLPGLRAAQLYAVRCGGGVNHRVGLFDAMLIKDNHIAASGGVGAALRAAQATAGHMVKVEIEVDTLEQLAEALPLAPDAVLLDNMPPAMLREAVAQVRAAAPRTVIEASGGVSLGTVRAIAETGVDIISVGALTHSAPALDIGLDFDD